MEYPSNRQHSGTRYELIAVTVTPNAAKFEAIVFE